MTNHLVVWDSTKGSNVFSKKTIEDVPSVKDVPQRPLSLYASKIPDTKLNIESSFVELGDGTTRSIPPKNGLLPLFVASTIDLSDGSITGGTIASEGAAFTLPAASAAGVFFRLVFVFDYENNRVNSKFSSEFSSAGLLPNPASLFDSLEGLALGYVDLESISTSAYKSVAATTDVIEPNKIVNFSSGAQSGETGVGGAQVSIVSANTTMENNNNYFVYTTSGDIEMQLPASVLGEQVWVNKQTSDTNLVIIRPASGEQIDDQGVDDALTISNKYGNVHLASDGTGWRIVPSVVVDIKGFISAITSQANSWSEPQSFVGVTDGSAASAGEVGEYLEAEQLAYQQAATSNTTFSVVSLSLSPGDWDVSGWVQFTNNGAADNNYFAAELSTGSFAGFHAVGDKTNDISGVWYNALVTRRFNVTTATTINLVGGYNYTTVGSSGFKGRITARRIR